MFTAKKTVVLSCGLMLLAGMCIVACDALRGMGIGFPTGPGAPIFGRLAPGQLQSEQAQAGPIRPAGVSKGRQAAARAITGGNDIYFDILQRNPGDPLQLQCFPLGTPANIPNGGDPAHNKWSSTIGGPAPIVPHFATSEYDFLARKNETEYVVSLRILPNDSATFSGVEVSFRAVNPSADGHLLGAAYLNNHITPGNIRTQADFPSNDDTPANRSLFDLAGQDVAVVVQGLPFNGAASSFGTMSALGPGAWLFFLRDDALTSGKFFAVTGARTNGPAAYEDDPAIPDGLFKSVQVNGGDFDGLVEFPSNTDFSGNGANLVVRVCDAAGGPTAGRVYAFRDSSGLDQAFAPSAGEGGFVFVIHPSAFTAKGIVTNPGFTPSLIVDPPDAGLPAGTIVPPLVSGYNEPFLAAVNAPANGLTENDYSTGPNHGPAGVHELGVSVFFVHN